MISQKDVSDELHRILQINSDWLKFAEAKNGALLAVNAGWIFGVVTYLKDSCCIEKIFVIPILLSFVSLIICSVSFIPILTKPKDADNRIDNIIFFHSIASSSKEEYGKVSSEILNKTEFDEYELHVIDQIVANAKIADYKYRLFKYAIFSFIASVICTSMFWLCIKIMEGL